MFGIGQNKQTGAAGVAVCAGMPKPRHACLPIAVNKIDDPRGPGM